MDLPKKGGVFQQSSRIYSYYSLLIWTPIKCFPARRGGPFLPCTIGPQKGCAVTALVDVGPHVDRPALAPLNGRPDARLHGLLPCRVLLLAGYWLADQSQSRGDRHCIFGMKHGCRRDGIDAGNPLPLGGIGEQVTFGTMGGTNGIPDIAEVLFSMGKRHKSSLATCSWMCGLTTCVDHRHPGERWGFSLPLRVPTAAPG